MVVWPAQVAMAVAEALVFILPAMVREDLHRLWHRAKCSRCRWCRRNRATGRRSERLGAHWFKHQRQFASPQCGGGKGGDGGTGGCRGQWPARCCRCHSQRSIVSNGTRPCIYRALVRLPT
jgi:hypothetical protein